MLVRKPETADADRSSGGMRAIRRRAYRLYRLCARRFRRKAIQSVNWLKALNAAPTSDSPGPKLSLWFGVVGLVCIFATSAATALLLSQSMTRTWIEQDERSLSEFVRSAVIAHQAEPFFTGASPPNEMSKELEMMFRVIAGRDPVFMAHFYTPKGRIFWSSDPDFIGRSFEANEELGKALKGKTVTEIEELSEAEKPEHQLVDPARTFFVETYIPILSKGPEPIGVVEIYRTPRHLKEAIDQSRELIWSSSLIGGLALYMTLGWIARWGDRRLEQSARALAESNGMAAIGEVATAVAHGLRNPLAVMRSSAELALDPHGPGSTGAARLRDKELRTALKQVVAQVDRLDEWIKALVGCLRTEMLALENCDAAELAADCAKHAQRRSASLGLAMTTAISERRLPIKANRTALQQVIDCLLDNAMEATPAGGSIAMSVELDSAGDAVLVEVRDTGPGVDNRIDPFALFLSTKGGGLGVGLPIARRLARRHGGSLTLAKGREGGAVAQLRLPISHDTGALKP